MEPLHENWEVNLTTSQLLTNVKQMSAFHYPRQNVKQTASEVTPFLTYLILKDRGFPCNAEKNIYYKYFIMVKA